MTTNTDSYDVLDLSAASYVETGPRLGVPLDGSAAFSIDAWLKLDGLGPRAGILSQPGAFFFGVAGRALMLDIAGRPTAVSNPSRQALTNTAWQHVAVTFAEGTVRFFLDGEFNSLVALSGTGSRTTAPFVIGQDLQAHIWSLRVFTTELSQDAVRYMMLDEPGPASIAAHFDFSVTPPVDRGPARLPVALKKDARMTRCTPGLALTGTAFAQPMSDQHINPGGRRNDPYTVQAWVYVDSAERTRQAVFVNGALESDTGMALYLDHDPAAKGFRVVSLRGSSDDEHGSLRSRTVITTGRWWNIATVFDGTVLTLFVDGVEAGSAPFPPVPRDAPTGRLLIGGAWTGDQLFAAMTLQGFVSRVEVWSRALSADDVRTFMGTWPDEGTEELVGEYDFVSERARNLVNAHPVGLADGADLSLQTEKAVGPAPARAVRTEKPQLGAGLSDAALREMRASVDTAAFLREHVDDLRSAMAADIAALPDPEDRERMRAAWEEAIARLADAPTSLPFLVTSHVVDGSHVLLCHRRGRTHVTLSVPVGEIDPCLLWQVKLVFTVVGGVIDLLFGLTPRLTPRAVRYIAGLVGMPALKVLFSAGTRITAGDCLGILQALYFGGFLKELILLVVEQALSLWAGLLIAGKCAARLTGGAGMILSLANTAIAFCVAYKDRGKCRDIPYVQLTGIKFDWDPTGCSSDAFTVRRNYSTPVSQVHVPQDVPVAVASPLSLRAGDVFSPAAYSIMTIHGQQVWVQLRLRARPDYTGPATLRATGGGILGSLDVQVSFFNGQTKPEWLSVPLYNQTLEARGVHRENVQWTWQYQADGGWQDITTTNHTVYVVLDAPQPPWQTGVRDSRTYQAWTDVLDLACTWAQGTTSLPDAAEAVARVVNTELGLQYDPVPQYIAENGQVFFCTPFVEQAANGMGSLGNRVNCTDCAAIVTAFSNILGCQLLSWPMAHPSGGDACFTCNRIQAIGTDTWAYPGAGGYRYHEVAFDGGTAPPFPGSQVYDACLKVDGGTNPWNWTDPNIAHVPMLPVRIPYTTQPNDSASMPQPPFHDWSFRERLARNDASGIGCCALVLPPHALICPLRRMR